MIGKVLEYQAKKNIKKITKKGLLVVLRYLGVPISIISTILIAICYITDIFYLGIMNEEESNMKEEIKYYTTAEYTEEDSKSFFESVGEFISGIFAKEVIEDASWPVVGKNKNDIRTRRMG